jgi:hypothetical protein
MNNLTSPASYCLPSDEHVFRMYVLSTEEEVCNAAFKKAEEIAHTIISKGKTQAIIPRVSREISNRSFAIVKKQVNEKFKEPMWENLIQLSENRWNRLFSQPFQELITQVLCSQIAAEQALKDFNNGRKISVFNNRQETIDVTNLNPGFQSEQTSSAQINVNVDQN